MVIVITDMKTKPKVCGDCEYCILSHRDYVCTLTGVVEQEMKMDCECPLMELDVATELMLKEFINIE